MKLNELKIKFFLTSIVIGASAIVNGQNPAIFQDVEIQNSLKINYAPSNTAERPLVTDVNGNVKSAADITAQVYRVSGISDIAYMNVIQNSIIYTDIGGKYIVTDIGPHKDYISIQTANGLFAELQPRDGGYYVEDFGATPDNAADDDSDAIQRCIDEVSNNALVSKVNIGPGTFHLDKGVVLAKINMYTNPSAFQGSYGKITMTMSGAIPMYSNNHEIGRGTVLELRNNNSFCIAIQEGRNCVIENISFDGIAPYSTLSRKDIIEYSASDWSDNGSIRTNRMSPHSAIVIDPFHDAVTTTNQYPTHTEYYSDYEDAAGTSMLLIKGCAFREFYIAVANGPTAIVQNGDNIRIEQSKVTYVHTFWAAGQSQSRANSIDNIYSIAVNRFVDCDLIGDGIGTPPAITNCNLASITKEFIHMRNSGRSPVRISHIYAEGLFSLGYINADNVSFHQCHLKFMVPPDPNNILSYDTYSAPYHLLSDGVVSFVDCNLEYYTGPSIQPPWRFMTKGVNFSGGSILGGIVVNGANGNETFHRIKYNNVLNAHTGDILGARIVGTFETNSNKVLMGGEKITGYSRGTHEFENKGNTYDVYSMGIETIVLQPSKFRAYFITNETGRYNIGDNLTGHNYINGAVVDMDEAGVSYRSSIGFVSEINSDTVFISGIPYGFTPGAQYVSQVNYPVYFVPMWGDLTSGSNTITNLEAMNGVNLSKLIGRKIRGIGIPHGTYITGFDANSNSIQMSSDATQSIGNVYLYNAEYTQTVFRDIDQNPPYSLYTPYITGSKIYLKNPALTFHGFVTINGGFPPGTNMFGALTH